MFAKRLLSKAIHHHPQRAVRHGCLTADDLDFRVYLHHGIPSTASILAFDPIQHILAIGTQDGRIKVIGGDGIEGLLMSLKPVPIKHLEFLQNQGFLIGITNDNCIQVWNLESRSLASCLQWDSNITAFSVISCSNFIYVGDEYGLLSVLEFDADSGKILCLPYHIPATYISEVAGVSRVDFNNPVVGILHQPCIEGHRLLIAYENGLIILWDISQSQILFIGGANDLLLKGSNVGSTSQQQSSLSEDTSEHCLGEKEITALCWASCDGSILAVGYVDGDILFWNTSSSPSRKCEQPNFPPNNVVRVRVSSAEKRIPVIVLQWSSTKKCRECNGLLFIYGGDQIGADEVVTILNLEWSSGMDCLRCVGRLDITLDSSFSDMILLSSSGEWNNHNASLFLLTNHGKLHYCDTTSIFTSLSHQERTTLDSAVEFSTVFPWLNPSMTVSKLIKLLIDGCSSKIPSKMAEFAVPPMTYSGAKWPLTGGVPSQFSAAKGNVIQTVYMAGYHDGSVRLFDSTENALSPICYLQCEGTPVPVSSSPVSSLTCCFHTLSLAVGHENGLVYLYILENSKDNTSFHFITKSGHEVYPLPPKEVSQCRAMFSLFSSPVQVLEFANQSTKLAVGFHCGQVAVLDMSALSVLFCLDCSCKSLSPVISIVWKSALKVQHYQCHKDSRFKSTNNLVDEVIFILAKDSIHVIDGTTGDKINSKPLQLRKKSTPISMYVLEDDDSTSPEQLHEEISSKEECLLQVKEVSEQLQKMEHSSEDTCSRDRLLCSLIYVCYEDSVRVYKTKSVIEGKSKYKHKLKHANPCFWASTYENDEQVCGLILVYQTGDMEVRSLPDFALVKECSLKSFLPCNFDANFDKTIACDGTKMALANGCELAFISLAAGEGVVRMAETLPCLHDKVLAAAADAAMSISSSQKKKQASTSGVLKGIVKGLKAGKPIERRNCPALRKPSHSQLQAFFSKCPCTDQLHKATRHEEITNEQEMELSIDDIEIDDPVMLPSVSTPKDGNGDTGKATDRKNLLHGAEDVSTPRVRTPVEIIAHYRKMDPSLVAEHARNKLAERQEKLEKIRKRTEDLQSGAEDFASLANELVKTMESRKRWHI